MVCTTILLTKRRRTWQIVMFFFVLENGIIAGRCAVDRGTIHVNERGDSDEQDFDY